MSKKLIKLKEGILVEVDIDESANAKKISSGKQRKEIDSALEDIGPLLVSVCRPIKTAWNVINQEIYMEEVEIELGLTFEGEGNLFVTKSKAGANFNVRLKFKKAPTSYPQTISDIQ